MIQKLKHLKVRLKHLHTNSHASVSNQVNQWQDRVTNLQEQMKQHPIPQCVIDQEREAIEQWKKWMEVEHSILKQKARVQWIQEGDENTTFFYASLKQNSLVVELLDWSLMMVV